MTIASEITRINNNINAAYTAANNKGATIPSTQNSANLATCISSISTSSNPVISSLNVTPSTSAQTITAPSGTDGYSPVNVSAVTSSIDANITAGNIKSGVTILGITGNYAGTTPSGTLNITANGTYNVTNYASANVNVSGGGGNNGGDMNYCMLTNGCQATIGCKVTATTGANEGYRVDYFNKDAGERVMPYTTSLTQDWLGNYSEFITTLHFGAINNIQKNGLFRNFHYFTGVTRIDFSALNSNSFGSYQRQFANMLVGITGCTVHFPSNLQSVIGSWTDVVNGFGGTNTTVLFDLPATT